MKKIFLIDGNSFIYRMFYALPEFATKDGKIVNATFGMAKFFTQSLVKQNPDYLIFVKDAKGENFRHKLFTDYKATRDRMPDNLKSQIVDIENLVSKLKIDTIEIDGYEADDVIGTLAHHLGKNNENDVYILSGDKDLYSLINKNVFVFDTMKKKVFGEKETIEKFGVPPKYIIDYLSIVGDSADNIPGIAGFGPKKAVDLINEIGSIEEIFEEVENVSSGKKDDKDFATSVQSCFKGKTFEKLESSKEDAFLSKKLATLELNVEIDGFNPPPNLPPAVGGTEKSLPLVGGDGEGKVNWLENYKFQPEKLKNDEVIQFFKDFEFNSLLEEGDIVKAKIWGNLGLNVKIVDTKEKLDDLFEKIKKLSLSNLKNTPPNLPLSRGGIEEKTLLSKGGGKEKLPLLAKEGLEEVVLDTETTSLDIMQAKLVGISIYLDDENIYYINRLHPGKFVSKVDLKDFLTKFLELDILIVGHNLKYDLEIIEMFLKSEEETQENKKENVFQIGLF